MASDGRPPTCATRRMTHANRDPRPSEPILTGMELGLRDRLVLITGAGGGTGPTVAAAFAAEGAIVALHTRHPEPGGRASEAAARIVADGGRAVHLAAALTATEPWKPMIEGCGREHGPVGVPVNATSAYRSDRFAELQDEAWSSVVDAMLGATYRVSRAVVPGMQGAGWGRIVNIAARSGLYG